MSYLYFEVGGQGRQGPIRREEIRTLESGRHGRVTSSVVWCGSLGDVVEVARVRVWLRVVVLVIAVVWLCGCEVSLIDHKMAEL